MEESIAKEQGDRDIASIKELKLNNCKSSNVAGLSEDWKSLESLNLANVGLTTLKGFPRLPNLKKLQLSNNNLCEGLDALACLPKLEELDLSQNQIKDFEVFEPLTQIITLRSLILTGCDVCEMDNYKEKIFELIPSLSSLDGCEKKSDSKKDTNGDVAVNGDKDAVDDEEEDDSINEEESDEEDGEEEEDGEDIPLEALYEKINDEGDDDEDFEVVEDEEDEDIGEDEEDEEEDTSAANINDEEESEETEGVRGTKRKHEEA